MDKNVETFFEKLGDENIKEQYMETQKILEDINTFVQNDIMKAQLHPSKELINRMETYMPVVQEFFLALKDKKDFIIMKGFAKTLQSMNKKIVDSFSNENMEKQYKRFQDKINNKSKEYERM